MQKGRIALLVAAAAAYGIYRYSKMTPTQKTELKNKGKDLLNKNFARFGRKTNPATNV